MSITADEVVQLVEGEQSTTGEDNRGASDASTILQSSDKLQSDAPLVEDLVKPIEIRSGHFYEIINQIVSVATHIVIIQDDQKNELFCLKLWRRMRDKVYNTLESTRRRDYLIDGLAFNRRFGTDVYLGVVPVKVEEKERILLGQLIKEPIKDQMEEDTEFALVMKYLPPSWQLCHQLEEGIFANEDNLAFLANEIVCMHKSLNETSDSNMGTPATLRSKLKFNIEQLEELLSKLEDHYESYREIADVLLHVNEAFQRRFEARQHEGCIKRCHGDLKASNLWIMPQEGERPRQLIALDCIDFNKPEFCHIDTLSDLAMLAVDIEMYLRQQLGKNGEKKAKKLVNHLLNTYIQATQEKDEVAMPLLEYYMAEKAMVCGSTTYFYDCLQDKIGVERVKRYLDISLLYARKLRNRVYDSSSFKSRIVEM